MKKIVIRVFSMLLTLSFSPETFRFAWCFPAAYVLLSWACLVIPGKKRVAAGGISAFVAIDFLPCFCAVRAASSPDENLWPHPHAADVCGIDVPHIAHWRLAL